MAALGCLLSKLTPVKNSQPFHSSFFHSSHLWHRAWAQSSPQPSSHLTPCPSIPASALGQVVPRVTQCPPLLHQKPADPAGELWIKAEAASGWRNEQTKLVPAPANQSNPGQTSGQPWKPSTVTHTNRVISPWCCLREAGPRCYLLNNFPISQGQSSLQLLHRGLGGHLWWVLRVSLCPHSWQGTLTLLLQEGQLH